ncbi:EAL domain-containing protein [Vibrio neptunius]|uniref:EAL domain-containing protein n=1 Tax=Vibrio neptunius TaxID=170651 RepID=A0ABS3A5Z3_9VIBR|nr:EAL domain-containing protein [Vibrio neptunius]MBN3494810.1 EAL domain-containing protein [Vibrio neptunius]MBN3517307.1 EAL domain-containing protein [Vibrio neptunius]MBN3551687.1 EAL domain-containing protein [Vibrio neptunius]MBN3579753.1 EAL domain-containing protein [Vibrio neptunius]MCH9873418.1 EAL domain-containing protein [Vibrio neptunius]
MSATTQITLRTAVVLPFVMIFILTIGVIVTLQKRSYEEMVRDISDKQLTALTDNVTLELNDFLTRPLQASLALSHNIGFNQLYEKGNTSIIQHFLLTSFQGLYHSIPQLDVIGFGGEGGEYVGFRKEADQGYTLMIQDDRTEQKLVIYRGQVVSNDIRSVFEGYDPRIRPWYAPVADSLSPMWSSIYANADERQEITLSALTPVFQDQRFQGVVVTDVRINTFNTFLKKQQEKTRATLYLFDQEQRLVAHSTGGSVVSWGTPLSDKGQRLLATESSSPVIKASAEFAFAQHYHTSPNINRFNLEINGERYFNHITPYTDDFGLQWYIGIAISESELLGQLPESQRDSWVIGIIASFIGILIGLLAFNRVVKPITSTVAAAKHLARGDWDSTMPQPGFIYETNMLVFAFNEMANNLKASFRALRSQLLFDSLTRLYSREGLIETCDTLPKMNGCLMLIGINKFRDINDSLGHYKGDQLLIIIAERLKALFDDDCYMARIGGDEFAVYFTEPLSKEQITFATHRVQQMFAAPFVMEQDSVVVNVSIGVVSESKHSNMTLWLRNGSIALSTAKQDLNQVSHYKPEMADISRRRTLMQAKIKDALEHREFVPFYQPIVDLNTGAIIGAEALARWLSPASGLISPLDFIPIAEESGLIGSIGEQILTQACNDTVKGMEEGKWDEDFHLHVNLSVNQLSQPNLIDSLHSVLSSSGLRAGNLTLEITESRIVDNDPVIVKNMQTIRDLGIHIAIDDFGTGYSSLAYLHKLPFDCLKIDRTFVQKMERENLDTSIVAAIINMTRGMKVDLVAEGIETSEQAQMLTSLNCPQGQGYLFSRPVPFDEWPTNLVNMK